MEKIEWFDDRFYKVLPPDSEEYDFYPSSTTILGIINKPFLSRWRGDIGNETADFRSKVAKIKGSNIHELIHRLLLGETLNGESIEQEEWIQVYNFVRWWEIFKPELILTEKEVVSHKHRFAGTLDLLVKIETGVYDIGTSKPEKVEGGIYVGDIKTGKSLDKAYNYQTASYLSAVHEMGLAQPSGTFILHTQSGTKRGWQMHVRTQGEIKDDFDCFLSAKKLYNASGEDKPKVFDMPKTLSLKEK